jgi:hypothetical protein
MKTLGSVTFWSTTTTVMPAAVASASAGWMPAGSDGLTIIALTPALMRLRISSSWPAASVLRCAMLSEATLPEASACALIEQIICSRQPLPCTVLETPSV